MTPLACDVSGPKSPGPAPHVRVRDVPACDFPLIVRLSEGLAQETDPDAFRESHVERAVKAIQLIAADPFGRILGAYVGKDLVGVLILGGSQVSEWSGGRYLAITSFVVARSHRGRGMGKALYEVARNFARSLGAVGLELHVHQNNARAQALYGELGFETLPYHLMRERFECPHGS